MGNTVKQILQFHQFKENHECYKIYTYCGTSIGSIVPNYLNYDQLKNLKYRIEKEYDFSTFIVHQKNN